MCWMKCDDWYYTDMYRKEEKGVLRTYKQKNVTCRPKRIHRKQNLCTCWNYYLKKSIKMTLNKEIIYFSHFTVTYAIEPNKLYNYLIHLSIEIDWWSWPAWLCTHQHSIHSIEPFDHTIHPLIYSQKQWEYVRLSFEIQD
jgi:hypothetical protein